MLITRLLKRLMNMFVFMCVGEGRSTCMSRFWYSTLATCFETSIMIIIIILIMFVMIKLIILLLII